MLVDLVARLVHRSSSATAADTATATAPEAVARHLALFARLLPGAPHVQALVWEVRTKIGVASKNGYHQSTEYTKKF